MRRFIIAASLLGLVACGGQAAPEAQEPSQPPETSQSEQGIDCSDTWECSCVKHTTQAACQKSWPPCYWTGTRCYPTYE